MGSGFNGITSSFGICWVRCPDVDNIDDCLDIGILPFCRKLVIYGTDILVDMARSSTAFGTSSRPKSNSSSTINSCSPLMLKAPSESSFDSYTSWSIFLGLETYLNYPIFTVLVLPLVFGPSLIYFAQFLEGFFFFIMFSIWATLVSTLFFIFKLFFFFFSSRFKTWLILRLKFLLSICRLLSIWELL